MTTTTGAANAALLAAAVDVSVAAGELATSWWNKRASLAIESMTGSNDEPRPDAIFTVAFAPAGPANRIWIGSPPGPASPSLLQRGDALTPSLSW